MKEINEINVLGEEVPKAKVYSFYDKLLLPAAFFLAVLFDRFVYAIDSKYFMAFWIVCLAVFYCYNWEKLKNNMVCWILNFFMVLLCICNIVFDEHSSFEELNLLVVPCVLMAHTLYSSNKFKLKNIFDLAFEWIKGWFIRPFSAIAKMIEIIGTMFGSKNYSFFAKVAIGLAVSVPILWVILPLLCKGDLVFGYYFGNILNNIVIGNIILHFVFVFLFTIFIFSFLWNVCNEDMKGLGKIQKITLDPVISSVVLIVILICYGLFCAVQFTYLFAGAGLPSDLTYSEYSRAGFWELIFIAAINLFIFGIVLEFSPKINALKALKVMLFLLVLSTFIMQVSAFLRLKLYIDAYGMTWLRMFSMWFIFYLFAVLILCVVRLKIERLPIIGVSLIILLAWFTVLGYSQPEKFIEKYNARHNVIEVKINDNYYAE